VALILAVAAALLLGVSDFCAARSTRTSPSPTVTRTVVLISTVSSPILLVLVEFEWRTRDALLGLASGVFMISGLLLLYRGYSVARMGIVAPTSSVVLTAVPVVFDLTRSNAPSPVGAIGMLIGAVALVLASYTPGGSGSVRAGVVLGLMSGVAFGIAFTLMGQVGEEAGLLPVQLQRLAGLTLLVVFARRLGGPLLVTDRDGLRYAAVAGVAAMFAIASLQLAFQQGDLGPVAVASSQFATFAVILSVVFNGERMRWWQGCGVAASAIGVGLMALG
jgi:drug/metabolite transporter (DMT)-like permease